MPKQKKTQQEDNAARRFYEEKLEVGSSCPMALATILHCEAASAMLLHHEDCYMVVYLGNGETPLLQEIQHRAMLQKLQSNAKELNLTNLTCQVCLPGSV